MSNDSIRKKIFFNTIIRWSGELFNKLGWFVFMLVLARRLGTINFGLFSYSFSFASLFVVFTDLGTNMLIVKNLSKDIQQKDFYLSNVLIMKIILSIVIFLLMVIINFFNKENFVVITIFCLSLVVSSFLDPFNSLYRADKKLYLETFIFLLWRLAIVFFGIIGIYFFNFKLLEISYIFLFVSLVVVIITYLISKIFYKINFYLIKINRWKEIITDALPLGLTVIFGTIFFKLNTLILQYISGTKDVGLYSASFRLIEGCFFISTIFLSAVFPFFCEYSDLSISTKIIKIFKKSFLILIVISISIIIPIYIFSEKIIQILYGKEFIDSSVSLRIIVFSLIFIFLNELYLYFFISLNKQVLVNKILLISAILYLILNIVLVKNFGRGYIGASWSLVFVEIIIFIFYTYFLKDILKSYKKNL